MNENKRLIKNTGIIAIGNLSTKLVSFLLLPLYTALLSANEYGTFDYILSISTFCVPMVSLLMNESVFRFLIDCREETERNKVISISVFIVCIGMLIFTVMAIPVMEGLHYRYTFYTISYILLSVISGMISALLRGIGRTDQYAVFNFLMSTMQILLNVFFIAVLRLGLKGMLFASINAQLWVSVFFIVKLQLWRFIDLRIKDIDLLKNMIIYSLPLIPNTISWTVINLSDRILIMNILGSDAVGIYAVANKFPNLVDMIYGFFFQSWRESAARVMGNQDQNQFYNSIYGYLKNFMYAVVLIMTACIPFIFKVLVNEGYYEAVYYIPILMIAMYFSNISGFYGGIFTAYKDTKVMGITTMIAAVINLTVNLVLIRILGLYAGAISTLVSTLAVYGYRKVRVRKYVMLQENWKVRLISVIITAAVLLLFYSEKGLYNMLSCLIACMYAVIVNRKFMNIFINMVWNEMKNRWACRR